MSFLVRRAMRGDAAAFVKLIEQEKTNMYKITCCYLKNEEDKADAIQETVLTCYEKLHMLKNPAYFKTWMTRILINKCQDILRDNKRRNSQLDIDEIQVAAVDHSVSEFMDVLNGIEEKYRIVLVLFYVENLKIKEIAQLLEMNENTVSTRLSRGRKVLANALTADT